jgi:hypothetical protein
VTRRIEMDPRERAERDADLRRRDRSLSERADRRVPEGLDRGQDPDGLAPGIRKLYDAPREPVVEQWPCRTGCGATIGMTASAIAAARSSVRTLGIKPPPTRNEIMLCGTCREREVSRAPAQRSLELGGDS